MKMSRILTAGVVLVTLTASLPGGLANHRGTGAPAALAGTMSPDQSGDNSGVTPDQSGAAATPQATAVPAAAAPAASGTVLASDSFSNPSGGLFSTNSNANWTWGYVNGDYQIASTQALVEQSHFQAARGDFTDQTVTVDAHLGPNGDVGAAYGLGCRVTGGSNSTGYIFRINTQFSTWVLTRLQSGGGVALGNGTDNAIATVQPTAPHHLSLTCQGTTISASVDGAQVTSVQDTAYQHGNGALYAYSSQSTNSQGQNVGGFPTKVDVRYDNFVITQP